VSALAPHYPYTARFSGSSSSMPKDDHLRVRYPTAQDRTNYNQPTTGTDMRGHARGTLSPEGKVRKGGISYNDENPLDSYGCFLFKNLVIILR
jgi:hypothetical protein